MKLKDVLKNIQEEWLTAYKRKDIFECPLKPNEIKSVAKTGGGVLAVRFIADNRDKKLYVFPPDLFHADAWEIIMKEKNDKEEDYDKLLDKNTMFWGVAIFKDGMWVVDHSDTMFYTKENARKFKWMNVKGIKILDKWSSKGIDRLPDEFREKKS